MTRVQERERVGRKGAKYNMQDEEERGGGEFITQYLATDKEEEEAHHWSLRMSRHMAPVTELMLGCHIFVTNFTCNHSRNRK